MRLPAYWVETVALAVSDTDDGYGDEVQWVLDLLLEGLRKPHVGELWVAWCLR